MAARYKCNMAEIEPIRKHVVRTNGEISILITCYGYGVWYLTNAAAGHPHLNRYRGGTSPHLRAMSCHL